MSERTVYDHVKDLFLIYSAMSPDVDWSWLHKLVKALRASAGLWTLKPRKKTTAQQIYDWGFKRMASVDAEEGDVDLDRAICFRDGLMLAFLITLPLRVRAFTALEIGKHLGWTGTEFSLSLNREIMKDNKDREFALPADFNEPMNLYLHTYRPILLNGAESNHLWISGRGVPLLIDSFYGHLADLSAREFGEHLNPHAFREIAATSIATYAPEVTGIIKDLLGHATMTMSEKHYNRANGVRAFAALEQIVRSVRNEAILRQMKKNKIILELPDEPV